jgi:hypothetical protein
MEATLARSSSSAGSRHGDLLLVWSSSTMLSSLRVGATLGKALLLDATTERVCRCERATTGDQVGEIAMIKKMPVVITLLAFGLLATVAFT